MVLPEALKREGIAVPCMFPVSTCLRLIRTSSTGTDKIYYASSGSRLGFNNRICVEGYVARFCTSTGTSELPTAVARMLS